MAELPGLSEDYATPAETDAEALGFLGRRHALALGYIASAAPHAASLIPTWSCVKLRSPRNEKSGTKRRAQEEKDDHAAALRMWLIYHFVVASPLRQTGFAIQAARLCCGRVTGAY